MQRKPDFVRQISADIDPEQLKRDLRRLRQKSLEAGAAEVTVVRVEDLVFSPGILAKVAAENNFHSVHWPLVYPKDELREAIETFEWAILFRIATEAGFPDSGGGAIADPHYRQKYLELYDLTGRLESACFYMGYYLAVGFATGNCRSVFCAARNGCRALLKGKTCRHPNRSRPSMEAAGIEAAATARKLGWEINAGDLLAGLVLVA